MINWETIKSLYNDKPTLLQWLKKVEAALAASVLQVVDVEKVSTSEIKLNFIFEDGTNIETPTIALPYEIQSVAIVNGHLILTLESGETLDAGNLGAVSGFSINAAQHLIVTYQDGTSQDLGAIFQGNVNIAGDFTADSIIENMSAIYNIVPQSVAGHDLNTIYAGIVKNGNKLTICISFKITKHAGAQNINTAFRIVLPRVIWDILTPTNIGGNDILSPKIISAFTTFTSAVSANMWTQKDSSTPTSGQLTLGINTGNLTAETEYYIRYEETFLLSDNLAQ